MRAIVTGSAGLVGSATVRALAAAGWRVDGIDNDGRAEFFGPGATTRPQAFRLVQEVPNYRQFWADVSDWRTVESIVAGDRHEAPAGAIVHAAAQPSHDWAARDPRRDFDVNAVGTLNVLEAARRHCPEAAIVHVSTNKVYGDTPNRLPLERVHLEAPLGADRLDLPWGHPWYDGVDESMSIDASLHSLFGASKLAADVVAQEYARLFGMKVGVFRCGCLTGPDHAGVELHGFLAYLVRCASEGRLYRVIGHGGRQVRDNLDAADLARAFLAFVDDPEPGGVWNMGGGRQNACSVLEAIALVEARSGGRMRVEHEATARLGDHAWWISSTTKFRTRYPSWTVTTSLGEILDRLWTSSTRQRRG